MPYSAWRFHHLHAGLAPYFVLVGWLCTLRIAHVVFHFRGLITVGYKPTGMIPRFTIYLRLGLIHGDSMDIGVNMVNGGRIYE